MEISQENGDNIVNLNVITQTVETTTTNKPDDESQKSLVDLCGHISPTTLPSCLLCDSQINYEVNDNNIRVLMAMAIGLRDNNDKLYDGDKTDDRFPLKQKKSWHPGNDLLVKEIKRRKKIMNDPSNTSQQTKRCDAIDWMMKNPLTESEDVLFVKGQMDEITKMVKNAEKEKEDMKRHINWTGTIPHLRLIHCLVDNENIRAAFLHSLKVMDKYELDEKKHSDNA